jgi:tagaturonate reductase
LPQAGNRFCLVANNLQTAEGQPAADDITAAWVFLVPNGNRRQQNDETMKLSKKYVQELSKAGEPAISTATLLALPEKVLQFGTGVLLRGLPDYFIDKANKQGVFNGRIVVVKSTSQGGTDEFSSQDNLYTQCVRGISNGQRIEETVINMAISRVLTASEQWQQVLDCAADAGIQIIISNTTEVGITLLDNDNVNAAPPSSFPGKLLAFLLERYKHFNGSAASGLVIIPTELITGNGTKLKNIVLELAAQNKLEPAFINWISSANDFCNSLVDRIVPGKLPAEEKAATENKLGYTDDLMIMSEIYRLWAIETSSGRTRDILSFAAADSGVVIAPDIDKFRELKLRLLNGSHTFTCGLAILMGFATVKQAMGDRLFIQFISQLMIEEIVPAITGTTVTAEEGKQFAAQVLDRYKNPFLEHQWLSISLQYSSKMKMRNVPVLQQRYRASQQAPGRMALGFAAYLLFMQSTQHGQQFTGNAGGNAYTINDDKAALLHGLWDIHNTNNFVENVLANIELWGVDLSALPGFGPAVSDALDTIHQKGITAAVEQAIHS